ncbi:hypothetical protein BJ322DRAFT_96 [Thelephora terrestris]|uniref:Uncharacterized protein n=1 Tax=Thelephora terrestris TaxID=56493 RepID=A0A9P6HP45_9AGAM|nr:hypothetical protein BJ322DRAFT_96 [Thelephora terrestris]
MISSAHRSSNSDEDLLYSSATPSHTRRPSWPLSFGFDSNISNGIPQYTSMSSIPFPSGQTASVRRPQRRRRESGELPQPWMFAPDHQVHRDDSEEVLYVASPPVPQFPPTMSASPSLNGRKRSTRSGYPFADDSSNCIYTASPKPHQPCLPARNVSFPPSYTSTSSPFQPSNPYPADPSLWNGKGGGPNAIYSTANSTGCLFSSSGSSGALLSLNQANLMLLQKADSSSLIPPPGGSRSRRSSHGRTSSLESISEEEEE